MKLKEKLFDAVFNNAYEFKTENVIPECEKIADDYAVAFAEWCDDNYFRMGNTNIWSVSTDFENNIKLTTNDLLLIFKKQN